MKKHKDNEEGKEKGHSVKTPPPPQVMNPSIPPEKQSGKDKGEKNKGHDQSNPSIQKKKKSEEQILAPNEEL